MGEFSGASVGRGDELSAQTVQLLTLAPPSEPRPPQPPERPSACE